MTPSIIYLHMLQRELVSIWFKNNCMFFYFPHLIQLDNMSTSKQCVGIILFDNMVHTFTYIYCKEKLSSMWFGSNCMFLPSFTPYTRRWHVLTHCPLQGGGSPLCECHHCWFDHANLLSWALFTHGFATLEATKTKEQFFWN